MPSSPTIKINEYHKEVMQRRTHKLKEEIALYERLASQKHEELREHLYHYGVQHEGQKLLFN